MLVYLGTNFFEICACMSIFKKYMEISIYYKCILSHDNTLHGFQKCFYLK